MAVMKLPKGSMNAKEIFAPNLHFAPARHPYFSVAVSLRNFFVGYGVFTL